MDKSSSPAALMKFPAKDNPDFQELPRYRRWSYITAAIWEDIAGRVGGSLRFIWQHHVVNEDTKRVIEQAAGVDPGKFDHPYPGIEIEPTAMDDNTIGPKPDQMKFEALLGSPNRAGVAWLLVSRRKKFPSLNIKSVRIFTILHKNGATYYQMLFTLG